MSPRGLEVRREERSRGLEANHVSVCAHVMCVCACMCMCVRMCVHQEGGEVWMPGSNHASVCACAHVHV